MKVELTSRHYGVHKPFRDTEIPGEFGDYAIPIPGVRDEFSVDEDRLLAALPEKFLPVPASRVLLAVADDTGGTGQTGLSKFRNWAKYFDAYMLTLVQPVKTAAGEQV